MNDVKVHDSAIELSQPVKSALSMKRVAETAARLRQLPEVLGLSDTEIADSIGITTQQWSNFKAGIRAMDPWTGMELSEIYEIPMRWIYGGRLPTQPGAVPPKLRKKLVKAQRQANEDVARKNTQTG